MRLRTLLRSEDGNALVEVAFALPVLAILMVGTIDYGVYVERKMQVVEAAGAAAAYGSVSGKERDTEGMKAAALNASPRLTGMTVTATSLWTCTPGGTAVTSTSTCASYGTPIQYVQVKTTALVAAPIPLLALPGTMTVAGQATYRVAWKP